MNVKRGGAAQPTDYTDNSLSLLAFYSFKNLEMPSFDFTNYKGCVFIENRLTFSNFFPIKNVFY